MADAAHVAWDMARLQFLDMHEEFDRIQSATLIPSQNVHSAREERA